MSFLFKLHSKPKPLKNSLEAKEPLKNINKKLKNYLEKYEAFLKAEEELATSFVNFKEDSDYAYSLNNFGSTLKQMSGLIPEFPFLFCFLSKELF